MGKKPRMPKSYIAAVKPAAFARLLGKATHSSGAQIKLAVLLLLVFKLLNMNGVGTYSLHFLIS